MAQRDLKLNTLGRYGKDSSRLILEEHGHCEVPAGCGGAVLRWRNRDTGLLFLVQLFSTAECRLLLDGAPLPSGLPLVAFGDHVISLAITGAVPGAPVFAFSAIHDENESGFPRVSQPSGRKVAVLSAGDGTWKYSTTDPADEAWARPGYDNSHWPAMTEREPPKLDAKDMNSYRLKDVLKSGAACLGADDPSPRLWVRKHFTVRPAESVEQTEPAGG